MDIKPREFRIQLRENLSQVISGDVAVAVLCVHRNRLSDFYRTRVRSLAMLVSDSLTHSLTDSCLVNLMAMNVSNCLMMSQQLLKAVTSVLRLKKLCTRVGQDLEVEV